MRLTLRVALMSCGGVNKQMADAIVWMMDINYQQMNNGRGAIKID
jgi:hypothetical protein